MKKGYQIIGYTADIGLKVQGKTLALLFQNAAMGMCSIIADPKSFAPKKTLKIQVRATDWENLLVKTLSEILYYGLGKKIGLSQVKIKKIKPFHLTAELIGEKIDLKRRPIYREIKAVTYHNLKIKKTKSGFAAKIIFDI